MAEQRVAAYEKLLMNLGARDAEVQAKLNEQKIVLKERKITNVVMENAQLKESNANLLEQNNMMIAGGDYQNVHPTQLPLTTSNQMHMQQ